MARGGHVIGQSGKQFWVFQAAAADDRGEWPERGRVYPWAVKQFREELHAGQEVAIWQPGKDARLLGFAKTVSGVQQKPFLGAPLSVRYKVTELCNELVTREVLRRVPVLRGVRPFRPAMGGIFKLKATEWKQLRGTTRRLSGIQDAPVELANIELTNVAPDTKYREIIRHVPQSKRRVATNEHELVRAYCEFIGEKSPIAKRIGLPSGSIICDLYDPKRRLLIEAKSTDVREDIRMAIGELYDYGYWIERKIGRPVSKAVLIPHKPSQEMFDVLTSAGIIVIWQTSDGFQDYPPKLHRANSSRGGN
jgi:hypothetical protein